MFELQRCGQAMRRRRQVRKRCKLGEAESEAATELASFFDADLLVEIFIRLPDYRCVIHCGLVCKRWSSIIFGSNYRMPSRFTHHHLQLGPTPMPYTLLFRYCYSGAFDFSSFKAGLLPSYDLFSSKSQVLHGQRKLSPWSWPSYTSTYLDFLGSPAAIRSSYADLLLVQRSKVQFCICNPLTKQSVPLPELPPYFLTCCGFVCKPNCNCNYKQEESYFCNCSGVKYRVVVITFDRVWITSIFHSETGKWNHYHSSPSFPRGRWASTSVACNGVVYWPIGNFLETTHILGYDPFKEEASEQYSLISLPEGLNSAWEEGGLEKPRLGVIKGRLRLAQGFHPRDSKGGLLPDFALKVWQLNFNGWDLVHDVVIKPEFKFSWKECILLVGLHPQQGDVYFFFRTDAQDKSTTLYKYQIGRPSFEKLRTAKGAAASRMSSLLHPWLPTKIPPLPPI